MSVLVPTEDAEQRAFVQYLRIRGHKYFHVPNSTYTKSRWQKTQNTSLGVVRGVPDMFVIVNNQLVAVELKRTRGSVTSPEQRQWLAALNAAGVPATVAKGAQAAIELVQGFEGKQSTEVEF